MSGISDTLHELARSAREQLRSPLFLLAAGITLGLGVGLNTALFAMINAAFLRPYQVLDRGRLFEVEPAPQVATVEELRMYRDRLLSALSGTALSNVCFQFEEYVSLDGIVARGLVVSDSYFEMLSDGMALGRPPGEGEVVVSYRSWKTLFGSNAKLPGSVILINGRNVVVSGVAKKTFAGFGNAPPDFWTLARSWMLVRQQVSQPKVLVRLRPQVDPEHVTQQLTALVSHSVEPRGVRAQPVRLASSDGLVREGSQTAFVFLPLIVVFGLTMLIPVVNVSNMLLARGVARAKSMAIRAALGASSLQVIRACLVEIFPVSIVATAVGVVMASIGTEVGVWLLFSSVPAPALPMLRTMMPEASIDHRVLAFALLAAIVVANAAALGPAIGATRQDLLGVLQGRTAWSSVGGGRLRKLMLGLQSGSCACLLIVALLLTNAGRKMARFDLGFDARSVFSFESTAPLDIARLQERLGAEAWARSFSLNSDPRAVDVVHAGSATGHIALFSLVSNRYFETFGIGLLAGRSFSSEECKSEASLAIVSKRTADDLFGGQAIGQIIRVDESQLNSRDGRAIPVWRELEIVGVAADVASGKAWEGIDKLRLYMPASRTDGSQRLFVRGNSRTMETRRSFEEFLRSSLERRGAAMVFTPMDRKTWDAYPLVVISWLCRVAGGVAALLTVSGVFGLTCFLIAQRTREFGIRIALGAQARTLVSQTILSLLGPAAVGGAVGAAAAAWTANLVKSSFGEWFGAFEPGSYFVGVFVVVAIAGLAALFPALRGAHVNPVVTLRVE